MVANLRRGEGSAKAFNDPDPALMERFAIGTKFYLDTDPVIEVARALHRSETVTQDTLEQAAVEGLNQSMFGQGLELSLRYLHNRQGPLARAGGLAGCAARV